MSRLPLLSFLIAQTACGVAEPWAESDSEPPNAPESTSATADDPIAAEIVRAARTRFAEHLMPGASVAFESRVSGRGAALVRQLAGDRGQISLPQRADGTAELSHQRSGTSLEIVLAEAGSSEARWVDGLLVYPSAGPESSHLLVRPTEGGSEDLFYFEQAPKVSELHYTLRPRGVGGLRMVQGALEVLDRLGIARLRVRAPYVIDAKGVRHAASLRVTDCPVDVDARAATGRAFVQLGANSSCQLSLSWPRELEAPLLVDPQWEQAALMSVERTHHASTLLPDGRVLVTGGFDIGGNAVAQAEIFCPEDVCPAGATFSLLGSTLAVARGAHTSSLIDDVNDLVLIAGGRASLASATGLASAERFDVASETFSGAGNMSAGRHGHTATVVGTPPRVLVAGGDSANPSTAQVYDPTAGFGAAINLADRRRGHVAELAGNGRVLIAGGVGSLGFALGTAELFDPASSTFAATGNMSSPRAFATATRQDDAQGTVLVVGGTNAQGFYYKTADVFVPNGSGGGAFQQQPLVMQTARAYHAATKLVGAGTVLITGGTDGNNVLSDTEVFVLGSPAFALASTMNAPHNFHTATALTSGRAVVIGGGLTGTPTQPESGAMLVASAIQAEILLRSNGDACNGNGECASGVCYDMSPGVSGVCCTETCSDPCRSCRPEQTADPIDPGGECLIVADNEPVLEQCQSDVELALICVGGVVTTGNIKVCAPYVCNANFCFASCSSDAECDQEHYCVDPLGPIPGTCTPKQAPGATCSGESQCESGFCVDGLCCNVACGGQCQACSLPGSQGTCQQVPNGPPLGGRPACDGAGTDCAGHCGTNPVACNYDPVPCGASSCSEGVRNGGRCDPQNPGTCVQSSETCEPYACDNAAVACLAACATANDCASGAVCRTDNTCALVESAECDGDHTVIEPSGTRTDCSPFRCDGASCLNRCNIVDDCIAGKVCDAGGQCVDPPPDPAAPEDCAYRGPPSTGHGPIALFALASLAWLSRRSRRGLGGVR